MATILFLIKKFEPSHLGSHSLGFPSSCNESPSKTALSHHQYHFSITTLMDLVNLDWISMQSLLPNSMWIYSKYLNIYIFPLSYLH